MGDRLIATLIGGALAVLAHVALPDHSLIRLRQRAGELLKTEIDYAATVIKAFVHRLDHPGEALAAAWERAFRARAAFEAAAGATRVEERDIRRWLKAYRTALNAVTTSCTTLETSLPAQPPPPKRRLRRRRSTSTSRRCAVTRHPVRRGASTTSNWPVRSQRVRDAAMPTRSRRAAGRVLVAEIGTSREAVAASRLLQSRAHRGAMKTPSASTVTPSASARWPTAKVLTPSVRTMRASTCRSPSGVMRR